MGSGKVACLGLMVADIVGRPIDALPTKGTLDVIERIELHNGGNGANTSVALAKLGTPVVALGRVGQDGFGEFILSTLKRWGVETQGIGVDPVTPTAATMVTVHSDAERSFLHVPGANAVFTADHVDWDAAADASFFHVAGLELMTAFEGDGVASALEEAKRRGMTTMLDTVMNPRSRWWDGLAPAIPYIDWLVPSIVEADKLTGETVPARQVDWFRAAGSRNIVIKMGEMGCLVAPEHETPFQVPAFSVNAIDSLGAGDSWCAGFLTGLAQGWPLLKTVRFANAVGACCVQALGASTGIRPMSETLAMLEE
ncbi:MAG: carbohydrate kinase family protein [Capsulimonadales bacterium]|nr:carbohydrate kinase family protein [Capsulimonadales bacterium]